ncbi:MAG: AAA family ATPase [Candidatus Marinimicrobia bacterium]|nr:AAA family ATPase [Candidatus Neomarinimicrobiota bacterium]
MYDANRYFDNKIISFLSGKGGTGKTSIVTNLGFYLAMNNAKVLLLDMDFFTRGLTFYITKGTKSFEGSIFDTLRDKEDFRLTPILPENLYLLPPFEEILDLTSSTQIDEAFKLHRESFARLLDDLKQKFDFILIDQRSGIDPLTISSALCSDAYIIVTEEDRTSQRTSHLLMQVLEDYKKKLDVGRKNGAFLGFIVNMYTTKFGSDLIQFLETSVFEQRCLAAIPHFSTVRKVFVRDEIMVQKRKNHYFSREINSLAETLRGRKVLNSFLRAKRRRRLDLLIPAIIGMLAVYASGTSYFLFQQKKLLDVEGLMITLLPLILYTIWLLIRRD